MNTQTIRGELIRFNTADGLALHGFLTKSRAKNTTLIIHQHGMTGEFARSPLHWEYAKSLSGTKFDLMLANNRGTGIKTKFYKGKKKIYIGTAFEDFKDCIKDTEAMIRTAKALGYKEIILSGHSTGCQKSVYYQAKKQNPFVKALVLLGPGDDYTLARKRMGKDFEKAVKLAKKLAKSKKGDTLNPLFGEFSAKRFLSYADLKNPEGKIFNYGGKFEDFSKIKQPIIAIFGSKDETAVEKTKTALEKLRKSSKSRMLITAEIEGAAHNFNEYEKETCEAIKGFLELL